MDITVLIFLIIILLISLIFKNNYLNKKNSTIKGPKGIPIFGNLFDMNGEVHLKLQDWYNEYGNIYKFKMGTLDTVVLTGYPIIKQAFIGNSNAFVDRFQKDSRVKICDSNIMILNGDKHNTLKKIVLSKMTQTRIKKMENQFISEECLKIISFLDKHAEQGTPFYINDYIKLLAANVIISFTFGTDYSFKSVDDSKQLVKAVINFFSSAGPPFISDYVPYTSIFFKNASLFKYGKELWEEVIKIIDKFNNDNKKRGDDDNTNELEQPIIINLLNAYKTGEITYESVVGTVIDLIGAGSDTSASTILFCIFELVNNKQIQDKLYTNLNNSLKEIEKVCIDDNHDEVDVKILTLSKYRSSFSYLTKVMKETYRKHPGTPIGVPHILREDIEIDSHKISAGTQIFQNVFASHRCCKTYELPNEFIPERYDKDTSTSFFNSNLLHYGTGIRDCAGKNLAEAEIFTFIATLFYRYEFINPNPSIPLNSIGKFGITMTCPENKVIIKKRK